MIGIQDVEQFPASGARNSVVLGAVFFVFL